VDGLVLGSTHIRGQRHNLQAMDAREQQEQWEARGLLGPPVLDEEYAEYQDDQGQPCLRQAAVLFLDQLGTRALGDADPLSQLQRTRRAVSRAYELAPLSEDLPQVARWFSDNLLVGVRLADEEVGYTGEQLLDRGFGSVVITTAWVQLALILEGVASRGGIDIGEFYADAQFFFGPALNSAYSLESKVAIFPRVVLGGAALKRAVGESLVGDLSTYESMIAVDEDEQVFVNYLGDLPYSVDEERDTIEPLEHHRELILERLAQFGEDERIGPKYQWMASFHNWVLQQHLPPDLAVPLAVHDAPTRAFRAFDRELLKLPEPLIDSEE
jgi:hypothetical protein